MPMTPLGLRTSELFGLKPLGPTLEQAKRVFFGDKTLPKTRIDTTSLNIATPRMSLGTWMGKKVAGRTLPILNLFNHRQPPPELGWSVRFTDVEDFRGKHLTYDSHNGTDFVIPPGTKVTAAAPGKVCAMRREFNRGGLKIYVDHGDGLVTTYNHLGRPLCEVGDLVHRGQVIALSAYSGADGFLTFPWVAPHVHFNTILGGVLVDPFEFEGQPAIWREENDPRPAAVSDRDEPIKFSDIDPAGVDDLMNALVDDDRRAAFERIDDPYRRGMELLIEATTYPTRFAEPEAGRLLYRGTGYARAGRMTLPFLADDYDGIGFADELGYR